MCYLFLQHDIAFRTQVALPVTIFLSPLQVVELAKKGEMQVQTGQADVLYDEQEEETTNLLCLRSSTFVGRTTCGRLGNNVRFIEVEGDKFCRTTSFQR
jgi:hypothetical protein